MNHFNDPEKQGLTAMEKELIAQRAVTASVVELARKWGWEPPDLARAEPLTLLEWLARRLEVASVVFAEPLPMLLFCPRKGCGHQHVDRGDWTLRLHRTHLCFKCGLEWTPALVHTVGVADLEAYRGH